MKKILPIIAFSVLALVACKKSTVSGTVIDPFTGKAVELPTVYIKGTVFTSTKIPGGLPDGKFSFENVKPGTYVIEAGKNRYSKGSAEFTLTKEDMDANQDIYIYSLEEKPGLYQVTQGSPAERIVNDWALHQPTCKGGIFALRTKFIEEVENPKTKKKEKKDNMLKPPKDVPLNITALFLIKSSVASPIETITYPVASASAKNHDCGVDAKETLMVPNLDKGVKLESSYKSDNLYEIKGELLSGRQILALRQDGKLVGLYYLNAK